MGSVNSIEEWLEIKDESKMIDIIVKNKKFIENINIYNSEYLLPKLYGDEKIKVLNHLLEEIKKEFFYSNNCKYSFLTMIYYFIKYLSDNHINIMQYNDNNDKDIIYNIVCILYYFPKKSDNDVFYPYNEFFKRLKDGYEKLLDYTIYYNIDRIDIKQCLFNILNYTIDDKQIVIIGIDKLLFYSDVINDNDILNIILNNYLMYNRPKIKEFTDIIFINNKLYNLIIDKKIDNITVKIDQDQKNINNKSINFLQVKKYLKDNSKIAYKMLVKCLESNNLELLDCFDLNDKNINSIIKNYITEKNKFISKIDMKN